MIGFVRRLADAWRGGRSLGRRLAARALGLSPAGRRAYRARIAAADAAFDRDRGLDTGGIVRLDRLAVTGGNARHGASYIGCDADEFARAMAAVDGDLARFTFVDLGSGKGRALLLAADYPFARLIGVEFAPALNAIAAANMRKAGVEPARFALLTQDAAAFRYPPEPLLLFLFNPFDATLMAEVARSAHAAWRAAPRPIRVAYLNPQHAEAWQRNGWQIIARGWGFYVFAPMPSPEQARPD